MYTDKLLTHPHLTDILRNEKLELTNEDIIAAMPHSNPRAGQVEAIRFALESFHSGKRVVIIEAPTGAGKSAIGLTVSEFFDNSYYLTIQKILQTQISRDYSSSGLVDLKGRTSYPCTFYETHGSFLNFRGPIGLKMIDDAKKEQPDCGNGYCRKHLKKTKCEQCAPRNPDPEWLNKMGVQFSTCPYYEQVGKALESRKILLNFSSFLAQTQFTTRFGMRDLMVIDEGHHCEPQLMDFVSLTISDLAMRERDIILPEYEDATEYAVWFHENNIEYEIGKMIAHAQSNSDIKAEDEAGKLLFKFLRFMQCVSDGMSDWVVEYKEHKIGNGTFRTVTMKPIFIHYFTDDLLLKYGEKVLIMSATILDAGVMSKSLGIKSEEIAFFRMGNYFPKENRPIYFEPAARMVGGKDKQAEWMPKLVKKVDSIIARYPDDRGIVHTHNFAIADAIMNNSKLKNRLLFQRNFRNKEDMLAEHSRRPNGVIIAPAMHEGLDLKDDLSRFQIIPKVPYPNFFDDKQLARRVDLDHRYLTWLVALKLVQSYGRSIRSGDDWAHTYVIDETFSKFVREADKMLPVWFKEAIIKRDE